MKFVRVRVIDAETSPVLRFKYNFLLLCSVEPVKMSLKYTER